MQQGELRQDDPSVEQTLAALRRLAVITGAFAACALGSYLLPGLEQVRPWLSGEGLPIVRMFAGRTDVPSFAEAGLVTGAASEAEVAESLGSRVAHNLETDDEEEPPLEEESVQATTPRLRIEPREFEGVEQEIEYPEALRYFFERLAQSAARKSGAVTRVAHYGDSSVAADAITHTVRRRMQRRFGDSGHGFVLISRGDMHYAHKDIVHRSSDGWEMYSIVQNPLRHGFYGYGGVQARANAGEYASFGTVDDGPVGKKVSRFELYYQKLRGGGKLRLKVDGGEPRVIDTQADQVTDAWEVIEVPDGPHTLSVSTIGGGTSRLYGVVLERTTPGVVYDSLGLVGARAQRLLNADPGHFQRQIAHRSPALLVLGFGGNEAGNAWLNLERYEQEIVEVVKQMRGGKKEMSCLLFAPLDQAERDKRGKVVTIEKLPPIVEIQRRVAKREGCAFFDTYAAMGGEGSIAAWLKNRPRLATSDLRHATPKGYEVIGNMYYKALLKAFAQYLERQ